MDQSSILSVHMDSVYEHLVDRHQYSNIEQELPKLFSCVPLNIFACNTLAYNKITEVARNLRTPPFREYLVPMSVAFRMKF